MNSTHHAASSTDTAAMRSSQQSEKDRDTVEHNTVRATPMKRKRPGPVPKLEHMTLQDFQRGGYFDMQIEVSLPGTHAFTVLCSYFTALDFTRALLILNK